MCTCTVYTRRHEQYHFQQGLIAPYVSSGVEMYYLKFHQGIQRWGICLYCFTSSGGNASFIPLVYTPLMCASYSVQCTPTTVYNCTLRCTYGVHHCVQYTMYTPLCTLQDVQQPLCTLYTLHEPLGWVFILLNVYLQFQAQLQKCDNKTCHSLSTHHEERIEYETFGTAALLSFLSLPFFSFHFLGGSEISSYFLGFLFLNILGLTK